MDWRIKAAIQKILSLSALGDSLNHATITFDKHYHRNVVLYQTHECLRKFSYCTADLNRKAALEIGTGYSLISAIVLSLIGFEKIVTVDVTKDIRFKTFRKQIHYFEDDQFLEEIYSKSTRSKEEINQKINFLKHQTTFETVFGFLNITYIAPYQFADIDNLETQFDYIASQVVLEHIPQPILDRMFEKTKQWLNPDGFCVHTINFIDHFANPGFFQDKRISEFNFLKYSDQYWAFWAGNPIAFTNRLSYLYYLELAKKHGLQIIDFVGENYRKRIELNTDLIHPDVIKKYDSVIEIGNLTKFQRGTLILKK
ncbi:MAG TPA: class I SAM-dependent methyltransferase [Flavobacterium sp.]|nr:class I SAM-dependent methyltransferase [Flavobacterium sp.]